MSENGSAYPCSLKSEVLKSNNAAHYERGGAVHMKNLFARIADRYDTMNRIMSLGLDRLWRSSALNGLNPPEKCRILDLACGTGDFTLELAKRWPEAKITGVDLTPEMIDIARRKLSAYGNVSFIVGDAQNLSMLDSREYSLIVCAFGFRNFPNKEKVLSECHRLLAYDGKLVVLELFRPGSRILGLAVNAWLAVISRLFAPGASAEYRYLRKSVSGTVSAEEFVQMAKTVGFSIAHKKILQPAATCISFEPIH
jgi:demethylmenaquinone methyltransferase/2-methoxy-6-polyprenyl-1,4-benzoquinol methylase